MFEYSLVGGIVASGADAYLMHVTTTPSVAYIARVDEFDCGIMISASHNPFYDNGIKLINGKGEKMDEVDLKTDARLRKALKQEITDAIVIIVAQRVSTILDADRIIVLDEGRVAGMGRHEELLRECPLYYEIAASQLSEEELQHVR